MSIYDVFNSLNKEKFTQIHISGKEFEDIFEEKLNAQGYKSIKLHIDKELKKVIMSSDAPIKNESDLIGYIKEPFNSQSFPDFLIIEKSHIIPIELKTSDDSDKPMWNNSLPKQNAIYVFMAYSCKPELREVVFFRGCDVITKEATDVFKSRLKEAQEQSKFENQELTSLDSFNHGWDIYVRANFQQKRHDVDNTYTSFVKHPNKELNKQKVLQYLRSLESQENTATM